MPDLPELPPDYIPREKRRVIVEWPYGDDDPQVVLANVHYAAACMQDSLSRGEAPLASHLLYAQNGVLDESVQEEIDRGIDGALAWVECADGTIVYTDRGVSEEMRIGIDHARACERTIETRKLGGRWELCGYQIGRKSYPKGVRVPNISSGVCELPFGHEGDHDGDADDLAESMRRRAMGAAESARDEVNAEVAHCRNRSPGCALPAGHKGDCVPI